jgi:hypothetical protein
MRLEWPRHQIHAYRDSSFLDFHLTDMAGGVWRYRRDPQIVRPMEQARQWTRDGLPFLAPELVLLFKSHNTSDQERPKDKADFEAALGRLDPERRAWLRWALVATQPDHPWIAQLA